MKTLPQIIEKLKLHQNVDAVFLTGSQGNDHKPYSDIDLVIVLDKHAYDLTSLYTWIDDKFADIFFFDHADLERIEASKELSGNAMDAVFVSWLQKATVQFDKSGKLTDLKNKADELNKKVSIPKSEKDLFWQKINYNFVANTRYFESNDPSYHEALEVRLLYSVSEVFTGYFEFRDILWRGEKTAMKYLKESDIDFYNAFIAYAEAVDLSDKFSKYSDLVKMVFTDRYKLWNKSDVLPQAKDRAKANEEQLVKYWKELTN
jgi:predicted nucleotidyltransferase